MIFLLSPCLSVDVDVLGIPSQVYSSSTSSQHCLQFYYHMYGSDIGTLNVYQVSSGYTVTNTTSPKWSMSYDVGSGWKKAEVTLDLLGDYQVYTTLVSIKPH